MNKKILSIIIIVVGLIILSAIVYVFFVSDYFYEKSIKTPVIDDSQIPKIADIENDKDIDTIKKIKEITIDPGNSNSGVVSEKTVSDKNDLSRIAISFAERFGTYSNQSNFGNITGLKIFMSRNMKKWSDEYIANQKKNNIDTSIYYGITTKAATTELQEYDDDLGVANILVITRRREATGTMNNLSNVFTQNVLVDFVKEDGSWKIDKASWLE
ncbi:MAG: hypothetical protein US83_C0005G0089 [Candidatus Falkowbacteria bacterium GW2011_GWC2_38_22]|uniref:Uncharacterized protein n=1 Tax=Candidatus Falkowbacteria bacterium GW2011_GWE1_38_31 TaxID=1618638 RepID=A0A0G0K4C9_9BACT|nr:MAG: hypothetical protein US73_C0003G0005 [Candidatus Falkowbacteria bacterium GW2011_GWF2_38_1205]KKQ61576.1 MAG: hypothetical protein US83_C0005G0089 [Candidatus Falkowbacteria bacterium GW2011_GWC2_38_22]KKQ63531.1 MAG: hypothetical protein US84_C0005G0005 [Candidatus Falkowbacteria bacterium GW2011_GWF1_38_22]KKQ65683.1 MAG: hypothetical protein US87_C0005G0005 [Candidatus Falkowbacteria bacterium GW2011_GWE2_38_254]KKQ70300.1 MAG: hypothetical protein US91_C0005G0005 [Candidatus Falkowb